MCVYDGLYAVNKRQRILPLEGVGPRARNPVGTFQHRASYNKQRAGASRPGRYTRGSARLIGARSRASVPLQMTDVPARGLDRGRFGRSRRHVLLFPLCGDEKRKFVQRDRQSVAPRLLCMLVRFALVVIHEKARRPSSAERPHPRATVRRDHGRLACDDHAFAAAAGRLGRCR